MVKKIAATVLALTMCVQAVIAQNKKASSSYGDVINLGLGVGAYSYIDNTSPFFLFNYEKDIFRNGTIAPFVGFTSYKNDKYRGLAIPFGAKFTYYLDNLLNAGRDWDFYAAASLGLAYRREDAGNAYSGNKFSKITGPYLDLHIGAEYHINSKFGVFIDLSTGVSTIGVAISR